MSTLSALSARRAQLRDREAGFTLIELLVVVIIIGILAAIAIPIYIGVQNNAKDSQATSDLSNARHAYLAYATAKGVAPTTANYLTALKDYGYTASTYSTGSAPVMLSGTTSALCFKAVSDKGGTGSTFYIKETGTATTTACT